YKAILGENVILGGDVIIGINEVRIANTDDLLSYLEQNTLPGQTINCKVFEMDKYKISVPIGKA
ncbi:MAG: hypothetical protein WDA42_08030, partial [Candidatus Bathyarchaeia archaeon]